MATPNYAFVDIESLRISKDFTGASNNGWGDEVMDFKDSKKPWTNVNTFFMGFGVGCIFDNTGIKFFNDATDFFSYLVSPAVDAIVSFNGEHFDFPLLLGSIEPPEISGESLVFSDSLKECYFLLESKSIDLLQHCKRVLGHRISLNQLSEAMFDEQKEMNSEEWWGMFTNPNITKRILATNYLLGDVMKLYKIWGVAMELGLLAYRDQAGNTRKFEIKLPSIQDLKK